MYRRDGLTDTQALEGCEKWAKGHRMIPVLEPRNDQILHYQNETKRGNEKCSALGGMKDTTCIK